MTVTVDDTAVTMAEPTTNLNVAEDHWHRDSDSDVLHAMAAGLLLKRATESERPLALGASHWQLRS